MPSSPVHLPGRLQVIGPGIVMAATGIGAGDFFSSVWAGSSVGTSILWAALFGVILKYYLTEGVARHQMVTGRSLVSVWMTHNPGWLRVAIGGYFLLWSVCVSALLMAAVALGLRQIVGSPFESERLTNIVFGVSQGALALVVVRTRSYAAFEILMRVLIGLILVAFLYCLLGSEGALRVERPAWDSNHTLVVLSLVAGVGGTVTLLAYGHWIREKGYEGPSQLPLMRLDCAIGYGVSGLLMLTMLLLAANVLRVQGIVAESESAARRVFSALGEGLTAWPHGRLLFAFGFWAIAASSVLGVWQSLPHIFAEGYRARGPGSDRMPFFYFRYGVFVLACLLVVFRVPPLFLAYALVSSLFIPFLAASLLYYNTRLPEHANGWRSNLALTLGLLLFVCLAVFEALEVVS